MSRRAKKKTTQHTDTPESPSPENSAPKLASGGRQLTDKQIDGASAMELRSIARQRGYDLGERMGSKTTQRKFKEAQAADPVEETAKAAEE